MTGKFGIHTGVVNHAGTNADARLIGPERHFQSPLMLDCLPGILRKAGFKTVSISPFAERHSANLNLDQFHVISGKLSLFQQGISLRPIVKAGIAWICAQL